MILAGKKYKLFDVLRLAFMASPVCACLHLVFSVVHAVMPTAAMALATANFVDTATAILNGERQHDDIYLPLWILNTSKMPIAGSLFRVYPVTR